MNVMIELPDLPDGYEYTGDLQRTVFGDMYLNSKGSIAIWTNKKVSLAKFPHVRFRDHELIDEFVIPSKFVDYALNLYVQKKWENV